MHNGRIHVIPEPDGQSAVPSSVPLDTASLVAGAAATGLATGELVSPGFLMSFVASLSFPAGLIAPVAHVTPEPHSHGFLPFVVFFGFLSVALGTWNLVQGLRKRAQCEALSRRAEELLHHDKSFNALLTPFDVHIHGHSEGGAAAPVPDHTH